MKEYIVQAIAQETIDSFDAHNAPELIRCKDCKNGNMLCADYVSCLISEENESGCHASHKPEWFCADGTRKDS